MEKNSNTLEQVSVRLKKETGIYSDREIHEPEDAVRLIGEELLSELDREALCIVNLKSNGVPINFSIVSIGSINKSVTSVREVMKAAILSNAAGAIILHNHPSGSLKPSKEDIDITKKLLSAFKLMNIELLDHVIVAGGNCEKIFSMRKEDVVDFKHYKLELDEKIVFHDMSDEKKNIQGVNVDPKVKISADMISENGDKQEYCVTIREVLERKINVMAESFWDAENIIHEQYKNEEIVLSADDFVECDIFCSEEKGIYFNSYKEKQQALYFENKGSKHIQNKVDRRGFDK